MYTESLPESHQSLTSLSIILCYTSHGLVGIQARGDADPKIEMEVGKWLRHIAPVVTP